MRIILMIKIKNLRMMKEGSNMFNFKNIFSKSNKTNGNEDEEILLTYKTVPLITKIKERKYEEEQYEKYKAKKEQIYTIIK